MVVEVRQMGSDAAQIDKATNRPRQALLLDMIFQRELIKQRSLRFVPWSQHRQSLHLGRIESATYAAIKLELFDRISPKLTLGARIVRCQAAFQSRDRLIERQSYVFWLILAKRSLKTRKNLLSYASLLAFTPTATPRWLRHSAALRSQVA